MSWTLVGCVFQWFMRRFHFHWWIRYNYILSTGLDAGVIFGVVIIFFSLQLFKGGVNLNWWGNDVWKNTADAKRILFSWSNVWADNMVMTFLILYDPQYKDSPRMVMDSNFYSVQYIAKNFPFLHWVSQRSFCSTLLSLSIDKYCLRLLLPGALK